MKKLIFVLALGLVLGLLTSAQAALTTVYDTTWNPGVTPPGPEWDLVSGLPTYPGAPSPTIHGKGYKGVNDILDYYYSSWTRIDDSTNDQLWFDLDGGALVKAIYTGTTSLYLGYSMNEGTGLPITAINGSGGGYLNTVGETGNFNPDNSDAFVWYLGGANKYSRQTLNPGGMDNMVSYRINGILNSYGNPGGGYVVPTDPTYVIGFEDGTDKDFQDFVVQVSKVAPVPEPSSMLLLGMGILGLFGLRKKT